MSIKTDFLSGCARCSDPCCTGDILISQAERRRILERWRGIDPFQYNQRFDYYYLDIDDECPLLDGNGLCRIYDVRPAMCRLYPFSIVPLKGGAFRLQLDRSCPIGNSIPSEEKQALRGMAVSFLEEVGQQRFMAFYESR
jgi:Fe-S-cluster containining protein